MIAVGISLTGKYILLEDDSTLPIVEMLDSKGERTDDPGSCAGIVYELPNGMFSVERMQVFIDNDLVIGAQQ